MPFSLSKAAKVAGVSKTTIHKWVKTGKLSAAKGLDGTYSIDRSELERVTLARKAVTSTLVNTDVNSVNDAVDQEPFNLNIYRSNTVNEVKYATALDAVSRERELLLNEVNDLRLRTEAAEARSEAAHERYHDNIQTMTRLLEDKREPPKRKKFLGIF
jgi:hypothetical protein